MKTIWSRLVDFRQAGRRWKPCSVCLVFFGLSVGLALVFAIPNRVLAAGAPKTIDPNGSCTTGGCHEDATKFKHVHWEDFGGNGQCQECHVPKGNKHKFSLEEDEYKLCLRCHEDVSKIIKTAKTVHDPVQDGCLDCHNPHGGETEMMIDDVEDENLQPLCFECHDEELIGEKYKHGPAELGACNECHDAHGSSIEPLLKAEETELCTSCHEEIGEGIKNAKFVHDPVEDGCTDCHDPHSDKNPKMLHEKGRALCNECHDDIVDIAQDSKTKHEPTTTGDECITCHNPHAANTRPNLRMPQVELCLTCHDKSVKAPDRRLIDMKKWLDKNPNWHKPIKEDHCAACHNPHGSDYFRILKEKYPKGFYNKFELSNFALCFSCHEPTLVTSKWTRNLTGFRDGNRNLHFLHVNRKKKGRSCRACHDVHASTLPRHIRERTRFGKWMMPLNYKKTETGGGCRPGCHEEVTYDRERADHPKDQVKNY